MNRRLLSLLAALACLLPLTSTAQTAPANRGWVWMGYYPYVYTQDTNEWWYLDAGQMPAWNLSDADAGRQGFVGGMEPILPLVPEVILQLNHPTATGSSLRIEVDPEWWDSLPEEQSARPAVHEYLIDAVGPIDLLQGPGKVWGQSLWDASSGTLHLVLGDDSANYSIVLEFKTFFTGTYSYIPTYDSNVVWPAVVTEWDPFRSTIVRGDFEIFWPWCGTP